MLKSWYFGTNKDTFFSCENISHVNINCFSSKTLKFLRFFMGVFHLNIKKDIRPCPLYFKKEFMYQNFSHNLKRYRYDIWSFTPDTWSRSDV